MIIDILDIIMVIGAAFIGMIIGIIFRIDNNEEKKKRPQKSTKST